MLIIRSNFKKSLLSIALLLLLSFSSAFAYEGSAKEAWTKLVGENFSKRAEFSFIENNEKLPNVLIYGDSISIHYTNTVRKQLADKANVYRLYRNGGDSASFIEKMTKMHSTMNDSLLKGAWAFSWDIIHFNVGLHDLKYIHNKKLDKVNGKRVNSLETYENNLRENIQYLKTLAPKAKLIFATTTPIPEGEPGRVVGDASKYNFVALKVMKDFPEVKINDLYSFTKANHSLWWAAEGNVHYNNLGRESQGVEVARNIISHLAND